MRASETEKAGGSSGNKSILGFEGAQEMIPIFSYLSVMERDNMILRFIRVNAQGG